MMVSELMTERMTFIVRLYFENACVFAALLFCLYKISSKYTHKTNRSKAIFLDNTHFPVSSLHLLVLSYKSRLRGYS